MRDLTEPRLPTVEAPPLREVIVHHQVPFHDLDPLNVVWHGNYLKYFELARQALFDQAGLDLYQVLADRGTAFPISRTSVKHIHPLRFRDQLRIKASVVEAHRKIVLEFEITLVPSGTLCARGRSEQVAVSMPGMELQLLIPAEVRRALGGPS